MYILLCLAVTILLVLLHSALVYYSQRFYVRYYQRHIAFEPAQSYAVSRSQLLQSLIINLIAFCLPLVLVWFFLKAEDYDTAHFICGLVITSLAYFISRLAMAVLFYLYVKQNPQYITGTATFQPPAVKILNFVVIVQYIIFLSIIAFFVPSSFMSGGLTGLVVAGFMTYFSKQAQANV